MLGEWRTMSPSPWRSRVTDSEFERAGDAERMRQQRIGIEALKAEAYNEGFSDGFENGYRAGWRYRDEQDEREAAMRPVIPERRARAIDLE